jgi:hypothetical protein
MLHCRARHFEGRGSCYRDEIVEAEIKFCRRYVSQSHHAIARISQRTSYDGTLLDLALSDAKAAGFVTVLEARPSRIPRSPLIIQPLGLGSERVPVMNASANRGGPAGEHTRCVSRLYGYFSNAVR